MGKKREIRGSRDNEYDGREWGICPDGGLVVHGSVWEGVDVVIRHPGLGMES